MEHIDGAAAFLRAALWPWILSRAQEHSVRPEVVAAQIWVESAWQPWAVSPAGARGLMQLMPATASQVAKRLGRPYRHLSPISYLHAETISIDLGSAYLRQMWDFWPEIPDAEERLRFALASYNAGPGHISVAAAAARQAEGQPRKYTAWRFAGSPPGARLSWAHTENSVGVDSVRGRYADAKQCLDYVRKVMARIEPRRPAA